jgi:hypothetical protein
MHLGPLEIANTLVNLLLGLCVAASGAFVYGRARAAAGFLGVAGAGYVLGWLFQLAVRVLLRHASPNVLSVLHLFVGGGKNLVFYGGIALAIRAIALSSWAGRGRA